MSKNITPGAVLMGILTAIIICAISGALFAWGLQGSLESILDKEIRYWDLFKVTTLSIVFLTWNPVAAFASTARAK